jgi:HK97 family phage major capsid protein
MAHTIYENIVLSNKVNEILETKVNLNSFMTIDNSLTAEAGNKIKVNTYTTTSGVEALGMGEGNTKDIEVNFTAKEYEVKTYQGRFAFYDEQEAQDPMVVDVGLEGASKDMINQFNALAIAEMDKATLTHTAGAWAFDVVVDAIAKMDLENEAGLFLLVSPEDQAYIRKALKDDLKYSEGFARSGYIGTVCGVPVTTSSAIPAGKAYLGTKDAVTVFIKKDTETEYERDAETRANKYFVRKVGVVALTNANKMVKIAIGG